MQVPYKYCTVEITRTLETLLEFSAHLERPLAQLSF